MDDLLLSTINDSKINKTILNQLDCDFRNDSELKLQSRTDEAVSKEFSLFFCNKIFISKISEEYYIFQTFHLVAFVDCQALSIFRHDNTKKNTVQILQSQAGYVAATKPGRDGSGESSCSGRRSGDRPGRYPSVDSHLQGRRQFRLSSADVTLSFGLCLFAQYLFQPADGRLAEGKHLLYVA